MVVQENNYHPSIKNLLKWFHCSHLPPRLQQIVQPFQDLAYEMANNHSCPETTTGIRKLLEAKDCAVRAQIDKQNNQK